jgi:hypothetical protein
MRRKARPVRRNPPARSLGLEDPPRGERRPDVDFSKRDLQDASSPVTEATVRRDYAGGRPGPRIYQAWVPADEVPAPRFAEREQAEQDLRECRERQRRLHWPDEDEEGYEDCGEIARAPDPYDWEDLAAARTLPPVKLRVSRAGKVEILDGNHRIEHWTGKGYQWIPAWVVDERGRARRPRHNPELAVEKGDEYPYPVGRIDVWDDQSDLMLIALHGSPRALLEFFVPDHCLADRFRKMRDAEIGYLSRMHSPPEDRRSDPFAAPAALRRMLRELEAEGVRRVLTYLDPEDPEDYDHTWKFLRAAGFRPLGGQAGDPRLEIDLRAKKPPHPAPRTRRPSRPRRRPPG